MKIVFENAQEKNLTRLSCIFLELEMQKFTKVKHK